MIGVVTMSSDAYVVHGLRVSFFTRKVTGSLDYLGLRWELAPSIGLMAAALEAGWNGGIPVVATPEGELIWDSTSVILHLEALRPERVVQPDDPTLQFLDHLLDDFNDEWFYRHAVGTRWLIDENRASGSLDIAREARLGMPFSFDQVRELVASAMTASLDRLGVNEENLDAWIDDSLVPWLRAFGAHVEATDYLFGARPALSDFAFFGGNAAHFTNDPACLRIVEATSPAVIDHTARLVTPQQQTFGDWVSADAIPETLVSVLAEAGRHYLPWVTTATIDGSATVEFESGAFAEIAATDFLRETRGVLLARYVRARSPELDGILERASILEYFAAHTGQASTIPDPRLPPRPADNRPYPAGP